ncbi:MAG TPA: hypothetical protein VNP73_00655, partial [Actinomycetota bacterium]|nr:hypothetical protein [Actinomycetota bacterium]
APDDWLESNQIMSLLDRKRVDLPEPVAFAVAERLWSLGMAEAPAGMLHYVMHPWVVSAEKLKSTGFVCTYSSEETFRQVIERLQGRIRIGNRSVPKNQVAATAAAAGLVGAFFATRRVLRRRAA